MALTPAAVLEITYIPYSSYLHTHTRTYFGYVHASHAWLAATVTQATCPVTVARELLGCPRSHMSSCLIML